MGHMALLILLPLSHFVCPGNFNFEGDMHLVHSNSNEKGLILNIIPLSQLLKVFITTCKGGSWKTSKFCTLTFQSVQVFWDIPKWKDE